MGEPTSWVIDEQQMSFVRQVFDLTIQEDPVAVTLEDIDRAASQSIGQNRTEMVLDQDTIDILRLYAEEGVALHMPLVFRPTMRNKRVVILDGNHRLEMSLVRRAEASVPCILVTGDTQVAQRLAIVVNTLHGRSTRNADYVATAMRLLREQNVPLPMIARMFGVTDSRVSLMTRRDAQMERARKLLPDRRTRIPFHTLDFLGQLEDAHVRILGDLFLDAPKVSQEEYVRRIREAPSADRDSVAHEAVGELREQERLRRKVSTSTPRPSSKLMDALQRMSGVQDMVRAYHAASDHQKAIMRSNLDTVWPRMSRLHASVMHP